MSSPPSRRPTFDSMEFVAAMAEGGPRSERAGRALVACFRPRLRARFFNAGVAAQDIDDLTADVLTTVVSKVGQLRDPSRFEAWVYTITGNVLNQHWTSKGRARDLMPADWGGNGGAAGPLDDAGPLLEQVHDAGLSDPVTALCLQNQLEDFRAQHPHRHACIELLVLGYDAREIAQQLDRSYGATRQFISQCCAVVMQFLAPCLEAAQLLGRSRGRAEAE